MPPEPTDAEIAKALEFTARLSEMRAMLDALGDALGREPRADRPFPRRHQSYTVADGVAAFQVGEPTWYCDGQFALLPGRVLGFFTLGEAAGFRLTDPTRVVWRPGRPDYAGPGDGRLPAAIRDATGPGGHGRADCHLFLRRPGEAAYFYAGPADLGGQVSELGGHAGPVQDADFGLNVRLPRDAWERFGGYPAWRLNGIRLDAGDVAGFDALLAALPPGRADVFVTRYEGDYLSVHLNADRGHASYGGPDHLWHHLTRDPYCDGDPDEEIAFDYEDEQGFSARRADTVPRADALAIARDFFRTGEPPVALVSPPPPPAPPPDDGSPKIGGMSEAEWLTGTDPERMLHALRSEANPLSQLAARFGRRPPPEPPGERALHLFAVACCRWVWHLMTDERSRRGVDVFERHLLGTATGAEWDDAAEAAHQAWADSSRTLRDTDALHSLHATTTAAQEFGRARPAAEYHSPPFAVAMSVGMETARAVNADYPNSSERPAQCDLVRDLFGNPFRPTPIDPAWLTAEVVGIAQAIDATQDFGRLPILADALEEAGCESAELLGHLRGTGPHVRGCWAVERLLGR